MRKDLKDIADKKDELMMGMEDVPVDGKEYEQMLKNYRALVETEEIIKKGKRERGLFETLLKIGGFVVTAVGVIFVPQLLADKSMNAEKDMSLINGRVWNLIGKNFDRKDKM